MVEEIHLRRRDRYRVRGRWAVVDEGVSPTL